MNTLDFPLEVKALTDEGTFEGYGAVFGNVDGGGDKMVPGAFAASLSKHRREGTAVRMLWNHNPNEPIGVWDDLAEDGKGLWGKGRLILDIQRAREVHALMRAKALGGLSIGYSTRQAEPEGNVRLLKEVDLWEVSPVTFPMNGRARISSVKSERFQEFAARLRDGDPMPIKEFEDILREAGVPKSMATAIASHGYAKAAFRGDPGSDQATEAAAFLKALRG